MTDYFRPLVQTDLFRNPHAIPLFDGPLWCSHVDHMHRAPDGTIKHRCLPVTELPHGIIERLISPRPRLMGCDLSAPVMMGVLNLTPDSFSDGGQFDVPEQALVRAKEMVAQGAHILDLGGESTRPGASIVKEDEEVSRTAPVIEMLKAAGISAPISLDTRKARVADAGIAAGADMINDVSALGFDSQMADIIAATRVPVCLMHAQGRPETMQNDPSYENVLFDVYDHLETRIERAEAAGIARRNIILDPGIGFGKTLSHNLALIRGLSLFHTLGCPLLLGVSRKSMIGNISGQEVAERRAPGSIAVALEGLRQGVQIIRVHDIEEHAQAVSLWKAMLTQH